MEPLVQWNGTLYEHVRSPEEASLEDCYCTHLPILFGEEGGDRGTGFDFACFELTEVTPALHRIR